MSDKKYIIDGVDIQVTEKHKNIIRLSVTGRNMAMSCKSLHSIESEFNADFICTVGDCVFMRLRGE
jgi:hypothetical protein